MKADALAKVEAGPPDGDAPVGLNRYLGACALAYIVDKGNAHAHAERVHGAIVEGLAGLEFDPSRKWAGTVPQMGAAFVAILALDIVYDDLTPEQVRECEAVIERQIGKIDRDGFWDAARRGTHGTWDIYKGRRTEPDDKFYRNYMRQMTSDGVTTVAPIYAFSRLGSDDGRLQKTGYADVLEFTGIDKRYYDNPKLEAFYRWLFGYSVTPAKQYHIFGDTTPYWQPPNAALLWRVGRFDRKAAAYAAWLLEDKQPPGHILSYILMEQPLPEPVVPQSRLFMQGGAVFREPEDSPMSLGAALYNITGNPDWHAHEEVNAISLAAYGNRLVVNGGWLGDSTRPPWKNNTLAIDGKRHHKRTGAGLTEGLIAADFDYACGDSGQALGDDSFRRSLILVHGTEQLGGYFITFDEVDADAGEKVHAYLQTASKDEVTELAPRREYRAAINHHATIEGVAMNVFYATEPTSVAQSRIASSYLKRAPDAGRHQRLEAVYETDQGGQARIATIFFPHDRTHAKADLRRIVGEGFHGALVTFDNGTRDRIIQSTAARPTEAQGLRFNAKAVVVRDDHDRGESFYFARHGRACRDGSVGFESDRPVSIFMRGRVGQITSPHEQAQLTLYHPDAVGVRLNGEPVQLLASGDGRVRLNLPAGQHELTLEEKED